MESTEYLCWRCAKPLTGMLFPVSRREECAACRAEIHVCRMCRNYQNRPRHWCSEDRAELPAQPDSANFCDYFSVAADAWQAGGEKAGDKARQQLDALFDDSDSGSGRAAGDGGLESLFGDD